LRFESVINSEIRNPSVPFFKIRNPQSAIRNYFPLLHAFILNLLGPNPIFTVGYNFNHLSDDFVHHLPSNLEQVKTSTIR